MGVFYNSICLPGDRHEAVRESLERWLGLRGYVRLEDTVLFDLEGETERSAFLLWNERWTVVVFSKYEEERRLIREFQSWADLVLYVWVQDSDVWGYDLFENHSFLASFSSDVGAYASFPEEDEVGSETRPKADVNLVCRRLGQEGQERRLKKIQSKRAAFEEEICMEFCRLLGVEAAMSSYDDLENGQAFPGSSPFDPGAPLGRWSCEQLLFVHRDAIPESQGPELHELALDSLQSGVAFLAHPPQEALSAELRAEMEQMRRQARLRFRLLWPVFWLAKQWRRWRGEAPPLGSRKLKPPSAKESTVFGKKLENPRHGCRIILAVGAVERPISGKPASVFAFQVGETLVTCTARRPARVMDVLRPPNRSKIVRDDRHQVSGLPARSVLYELPPLYLAGTSDPSHLGLHVIQAPTALYVFLFRFGKTVDALTDQLILKTVESFRVE